MQYHKEIAPYISTLESLLFTPDTPAPILDAFNQFRCLHR
jgi:hypothetical protein